MSSVKYGNKGLHDGTDDTKVAVFDCSGITTATERTITVPNANCGFLTSGTAQASTSGTSIDFTSIPSWVKRITVMFYGVSLDAGTNLLIQLGTSSTPEATGYNSISSYVGASSSTGTGYSTAGFLITAGDATNLHYGSVLISLVDGSTNKWVSSGVVGLIQSGSNYYTLQTGGSKALAATLDMVRITSVSGSANFDAGTINILYE